MKTQVAAARSVSSNIRSHPVTSGHMPHTGAHYGTTARVLDHGGGAIIGGEREKFFTFP